MLLYLSRASTTPTATTPASDTAPSPPVETPTTPTIVPTDVIQISKMDMPVSMTNHNLGLSSSAPLPTT